MTPSCQTPALRRPGEGGSAHQRKLVLGDAPALVLATIESARAQLPGHDEDDLLMAIEDGGIPFAWNIALHPARTAREFRLYPPCVLHYAATGGSRPYPHGLQHVLDTLLQGHTKPFLSGNTIRLLLNCGATHVHNLIDTGALHQLPGTEYHRGPNGVALVTRDSFLKFLQTRLEGAI